MLGVANSHNNLARDTLAEVRAQGLVNASKAARGNAPMPGERMS